MFESLCGKPFSFQIFFESLQFCGSYFLVSSNTDIEFDFIDVFNLNRAFDALVSQLKFVWSLRISNQFFLHKLKVVIIGWVHSLPPEFDNLA